MINHKNKLLMAVLTISSLIAVAIVVDVSVQVEQIQIVVNLE